MPTWGEILKELQTGMQNDKDIIDKTRRKYLALLNQKTGRNTIFLCYILDTDGQSNCRSTDFEHHVTVYVPRK